SSLLATFSVGPEFAFSMLRDAGAPTGKRAKVDCYTEVVLKPKNDIVQETESPFFMPAPGDKKNPAERGQGLQDSVSWAGVRPCRCAGAAPPIRSDGKWAGPRRASARRNR